VNIVHALVWQVPRTRLQSANRAALGYILLVTVLLALSLGVSALREHFALWGTVALVLYTLVPLLFWWFASWWFPHRPCPLIALAPGAALFAIGVALLHVVTLVWFPHHLESKSETYGTIGVAIALLLWAYLLGRLITLAAVLNAALWARFGAGAPHAIRLRRPAVRIPVVDAALERIWPPLFGREPPDEPRGAPE
jgi:uncharacterized BrkB/YihY/UPF0761 family membrane protein